MLTLIAVEAARLCCLKASMIALMDGSNKSATSWLCDENECREEGILNFECGRTRPISIALIEYRTLDPCHE
jgi:hypothetical protein